MHLKRFPIILVLLLHLIILLTTQFIDWPELILYPKLVKNGFALYSDLLIPYQPISIHFLKWFYDLFGYTVNSLRFFQLSLIFCVDILFFYVAYKTTQSRLISTFGLLLYVLWQPTIEGNGLWFDHFLLPALLLAYYFTVKAIHGKKNLLTFFAASFFLGLLLITKQTTAIFLGIAFLPFLDKLFAKSKYHLQKIALICICSLLVPLTQFLYYLLIGKGPDFLFWVYKFGIGLRSDPNYVIKPNLYGDFPLVQLMLISFVLLFTCFKRKLVVYTSFWFLLAFMMMFPRWTLTHFSTGLLLLCLLITQSIHSLQTQNKNHFLALVVFILCILTAKTQYNYLRLNSYQENRFLNKNTEKLIKTISENAKDQTYYHFGTTEYLYAYTKNLPLIRPYIQLFPWNTQLTGIQEKQINEIAQKEIKFIIYSPYHPTNVYYNGEKPEILYEYVNKNYVLGKKLDNGVFLYVKRLF